MGIVARITKLITENPDIAAIRLRNGDFFKLPTSFTDACKEQGVRLTNGERIEKGSMLVILKF